MENIVFENKSHHKYLIYLLGNELYGSPLLSVREVVEYKEPKRIPNSPEGFEGIISLRGEVIGVVDLRKLFKSSAQKTQCILILECEMGVMGAIVDKAVSVIDIKPTEIDVKSNIGVHDEHEYFMGIGKLPAGLVTLIDLKRVCSLVQKK